MLKIESLVTTSSRHHIENLWVVFHELSLHAFQKPLVFLLHRNFWLRKILHRFCRFQVFPRFFSVSIFKNILLFFSSSTFQNNFFEIRFKSDWIESRQNESIIRQTVIVHADMTVRMFLRHRIQGYVKLLIPYVSQHEVLGPLLAHMTSFCWRNFSLQISITNIDKTNRPTKSMLYCFSQPLFNLNRIVIGRLVRWYHVVSQYCTTNAEITQ